MQDEGRVSINLRPVATPLPLTFAGLLIASVILAGYELGWIPKTQHHPTGWAIFAVPFPLQILAAWWGFGARSAVGATGSGILAAAWLSIGLDMITTHPGPPGPTNAVGLMTFAAGAALLVPAVSEFVGGALLPGAVLSLAAIRFFCTGVSGVTHSSGWTHASGWMGIVVAAVALYAALALELESATERAPLPTFRRRLAKRAVEAPLEEQIAELEHSPGIRQML